MSTILLWAFSSLRELVSVIQSKESLLTVYGDGGGRIEPASEFVGREDSRGSEFFVAGSVAGAAVEAHASPLMTGVAGPAGVQDRSWKAAKSSFDTVVEHCSEFDVKSYPASLSIWVPAGVAEALAWARSHLVAPARLAVRGGILARRELLDAPGMIASNPWMYPELAERWPTKFDYYIVSAACADFAELLGACDGGADHRGLLYVSGESCALERQTIVTRQYPDIRAANRVFRRRRDQQE
jgi:hypothetical protein